MTSFKLQPLIFAALAVNLAAVEKEWTFVNGKLLQVDVTEYKNKPLHKAEDTPKIEWKFIDGKLTKIETAPPKIKPKRKVSQYIIDIPNANTEGIQSVDFKRQRDTTKAYELPKVKALIESDTQEQLQQSLSLEEQKIILPNRVARNPNSNLSAEDINAWGKELMLTKKWLNFHNKRLNEEDTPSREFMIYYQRVHANWISDLDDYQKVLERATKK